MSTHSALPRLTDQPPLMPVARCFPYLNKCRSAGYELIRLGNFPLPLVQVGKRFYVRRTELASYLGEPLQLGSGAMSNPVG